MYPLCKVGRLLPSGEKNMKCPYCRHSDLKVTDSRDAQEVNAIRRRRECLNCLKRFTTFESPELTMQVLKRDGSYQDFQKQKLINGLVAACRHTTVSHQQVIQIAETITAKLLEMQLHEISTQLLGEMAMDLLRASDPVAYIRFACVYCRFTDLSELMEAIDAIQDEKKHIHTK